MAAWMVYTLVVTLLFSMAALLAEQALRQRRTASRWVWLLAVAASLLLPAAVSPASARLAAFFIALVSPQAAIGRVAPPHLPGFSGGQLLVLPQADDAALPKGFDTTLQSFCLASSAVLLAVLALHAVLVLRRRRHWVVATLRTTPVYVAPDLGPAVVGLLRPRIVLPAWLMAAPASLQDLVLAHEQAHLNARDPQLLGLALCLLVLMPWNLPLWWQLQRLRRAMEVDCDARVLRAGHSPAAYGHTLLAVGQRQSGFVGMATAMSEPVSFLEQRMHIMLKQPARTSAISALALACLSVAVMAVAAEVSPPKTDAAAASTPKHVLLDAKVAQAYAGYYQSADQEVVHFTRDGQRLFLQFTGRAKREVWASADTELVDAHGKPAASVLRDAQGQATAMTMHRRSLDFPAKRITEAQAQKIADTVAAKIRTQVASPGTEAAVRRLFAQVLANPPKLDGMSPLMVAGIEEQNEQLRPQFQKLGGVKSVEFFGVSETGADQYIMRCDKGGILWRIALDTDGSISRVTFDLL